MKAFKILMLTKNYNFGPAREKGGNNAQRFFIFN